MSTTPVLSLTDELVAELEAAATDSKLNIYRPHGWAHSVRCGNHLQTDFDFLSLVSPSVVLALLAEREELKRDAARYRWLRDHYHGFEHYRTMKHRPNAFRDEIDAAMKS